MTTEQRSIEQRSTIVHHGLTAEQVRARLWTAIHPRPGPHCRTQLQLAHAIGVSLPFLNDILHGKREPSGKVLDYLGLERVVIYRFRKKKDAA